MSTVQAIRADSSSYTVHFAAAGLSHTRVTDQRPLPVSVLSIINNIAKPEHDFKESNTLIIRVITNNIVKNDPESKDSNIKARRSKKELVRIARCANNLVLKAEADMAPHVHYPYKSTTNTASDCSPASGSGSATTDAPTRRVHFAPLQLRNAQNGIFKSESQSQDLNGNKTTNNNDKINNDDHRPSRQPQTTKTVFLCPSIPPRAPGDTRPLIKFYSTRALSPKRPRFYRRVFLGGPPDKTGPDDKRIFYRREFL